MHGIVYYDYSKNVTDETVIFEKLSVRGGASRFVTLSDIGGRES